ncbi:cell division protein ZapA [Aurantiacibacter sp. MUD11]|uniref:cell division protein ZapA n=1 Tax=Aurantiacibacter sp. MUD11 TaxID=3003265 RepID=UPI0022AABD50|nr:cell division protein ZapA [Aurantiacibacter sp. MUD11]WAT18209.1 cell division protein ZapA [Aurantiacibacter sp. MUD11]
MSSNVTLQIAGRRYTIACAPGEEAHIEQLGASIDAKLAALDSLAGQSPERTLLYASLLLADELHEAKASQPAPAPAPAAANDDKSAEALENLADRLESLASQLESGADNT